MNTDLRLMIDAALDGQYSADAAAPQHYSAPAELDLSGYVDHVGVEKLAHALVHVADNLHDIGSPEEKLAELEAFSHIAHEYEPYIEDGELKLAAYEDAFEGLGAYRDEFEEDEGMYGARQRALVKMAAAYGIPSEELDEMLKEAAGLPKFFRFGRTGASKATKKDVSGGLWSRLKNRGKARAEASQARTEQQGLEFSAKQNQAAADKAREAKKAIKDTKGLEDTAETLGRDAKARQLDAGRTEAEALGARYRAERAEASADILPTRKGRARLTRGSAERSRQAKELREARAKRGTKEEIQQSARNQAKREEISAKRQQLADARSRGRQKAKSAKQEEARRQAERQAQQEAQAVKNKEQLEAFKEQKAKELAEARARGRQVAKDRKESTPFNVKNTAPPQQPTNPFNTGGGKPPAEPSNAFNTPSGAPPVTNAPPTSGAAPNTGTVPEGGQDGGFFNRLFGKKNKPKTDTTTPKTETTTPKTETTTPTADASNPGMWQKTKDFMAKDGLGGLTMGQTIGAGAGIAGVGAIGGAALSGGGNTTVVKTSALHKLAEDRINPARIRAGRADPFSGHDIHAPGMSRSAHAYEPITIRAQRIRDRINSDMRGHVNNVGGGYNLRRYLSRDE